MPSPLAHTLAGFILYRKKGAALIRHDARRSVVLLGALFVVGLSWLPEALDGIQRTLITQGKKMAYP
ncbi:MAG: hypothetical protein EOM20_20055 [Spartobacteria bacterium]|nr:hypothetical protein [Spartobacteria bacterium]